MINEFKVISISNTYSYNRIFGNYEKINSFAIFSGSSAMIFSKRRVKGERERKKEFAKVCITLLRFVSPTIEDDFILSFVVCRYTHREQSFIQVHGELLDSTDCLCIWTSKLHYTCFSPDN